MRSGTDKLRTLNVPQRVQVELENGRPKAVRKLTAADRPTARPPDRRFIESVLECWRIDDEWWRQPISRQCYEVVLETGGRVVLFEDLVTGEWWMQQP